MKEIQKKHINLIFILSGFFIITPNILKEVPFLILGIFSFVIYFKNKLYKANDFFYFFYFFLIVLSLFYSDNLYKGFNYIESQLPFFYFIFIFIIFKRTKILHNSVLKNWILIFNFSLILFFLSFVVYFFSMSFSFNYNEIRNALNTIPYINIHPIYLSVISVVFLLLNLYNLKKNTLYLLFFIFFDLLLLLMSGVRTSLMIFPFLIFILLNKLNYSYFIKGFILVTFSFLFVVFFIFNNDFIKRIKETYDNKSFNQVNINNSTSIRNSILDCSIYQSLQVNPFIGTGVGDTRDLMQLCYDTQYPELNKYYNTHNQYFSIFISLGFLGIFSFILFLYTISITVPKENLTLYYIILFYYLFMFVFENILERKYGLLFFLSIFTLILNNNFICNEEK